MDGPVEDKRSQPEHRIVFSHTIHTHMHMYNKENLAKIEVMNSLAPNVMSAFWAFDKASVAEGAIPKKYKELIAIAVALTTQCPYCIDVHTGSARAAGVTDTELVEASMVAAALRAGGAVTHASHTISAQASAV